MRYVLVAVFFLIVGAVLALAEFVGNNFADPIALTVIGVAVFFLIRSLVKGN